MGEGRNGESYDVLIVSDNNEGAKTFFEVKGTVSAPKFILELCST